MKNLLNEIKKVNFKKSSNSERKEIMLEIINDNLEEKYRDLFNGNNNLTRLELIKAIHNVDKKFINDLTNDIIKIMSLMQGNNIELLTRKEKDTIELKSEDGFTYRTKYKFAALSDPIFSYKIDGSLIKIEYIINYKEDEFLYQLIDNFENKFLKEVSLKRTGKISK